MPPAVLLHVVRQRGADRNQGVGLGEGGFGCLLDILGQRVLIDQGGVLGEYQRELLPAGQRTGQVAVVGEVGVQHVRTAKFPHRPAVEQAEGPLAQRVEDLLWDIAQRDAEHPHRHAVLLEGLKAPGPCPAHRAQVQRQKDDVAARLL